MLKTRARAPCYTPMIPFRLDEGTEPEGHIHPILVHQLYEPHQVISPLEIELWSAAFNSQRFSSMFFFFATGTTLYLPVERLVDVPEDVGLDHVQSPMLSLLDDVRPHLITKRSREERTLVSASKLTHASRCRRFVTSGVLRG